MFVLSMRQGGAKAGKRPMARDVLFIFIVCTEECDDEVRRKAQFVYDAEKNTVIPLQVV